MQPAPCPDAVHPWLVIVAIRLAATLATCLVVPSLHRGPGSPERPRLAIVEVAAVESSADAAMRENLRDMRLHD